MKKKTALILVLVLMLTVFTACDRIVERFTGPIIESQLEDPESGPQQEIDRAMEVLLEEVSELQALNYNPENYNWNLEDSELSASIGNPPADTSGEVTAGDIILKYEFTIAGEPHEEQEESENIMKSDTLIIEIDRIDFDADEEVILSMSPGEISTEGEDTPELSNLDYQYDPFWIGADVENIVDWDPKAAAVVDEQDYPVNLNVDNNTIEVDTELSLTGDNFGILAVVNRVVLLEREKDETGIAGYILYLQPDS